MGHDNNRLEGLLPCLISKNQSSFVRGKSITENILLAQESITDFRLRGKPALGVIKLDKAKTYDRMDWDFLIKVLEIIGFDKQVVDEIWILVSNN